MRASRATLAPRTRHLRQFRNSGICSRSSINPGPAGCHASRFRVSALEAGRSRPANPASHPKWAGASSGDTETTGTFSPRRGIPASLLAAIRTSQTHSRLPVRHRSPPRAFQNASRSHQCGSCSGRQEQKITVDQPSPAQFLSRANFEIIQHRLNRHTRLLFKNRRACK
jgi:hypothetical protein